MTFRHMMRSYVLRRTEVALRQKDARADALGNGVQLTVPNEVRIAPATGHPVDARFGIGGRTRLFDRRLRQVDAGDANGGDRVGSRVVLDQHRDAVAFFSRGAAGAQYVARAVRPLGQQFRESRGEEELELRAFAQEVGVMGGDEIHEARGGLGVGLRLHLVEVCRERGKPKTLSLARKSAIEQHPL